MTIISGPTGPIFDSGTSSSSPAPAWLAPSFWAMVTLALIGWGTMSALALLSGLLWSALAGFVIGWVRQAFSRRSRLGESLISALFGAGLTRDPFRLVCMDLLANTLAGFAVAILFARLGVMNADASNLLVAQMTGGAGGGPDAAGLAIIALSLLVLASLVGMLVVMAAMHWAGIALGLYLLDAGTVAEHMAAGATDAMVEDAMIAQRQRGRWHIGLSRSAAKGAVTGFLVGLLLVMAGLTPSLAEMLRR